MQLQLARRKGRAPAKSKKVHFLKDAWMEWLEVNALNYHSVRHIHVHQRIGLNARRRGDVRAAIIPTHLLTLSSLGPTSSKADITP
jgi:hypothetical protein